MTKHHQIFSTYPALSPSKLGLYKSWTGAFVSGLLFIRCCIWGILESKKQRCWSSVWFIHVQLLRGEWSLFPTSSPGLSPFSKAEKPWGRGWRGMALSVGGLDNTLGGGVPLGILGGDMPPGSSNPDRFQTKKVIFHTRFQTRPLKSIPVFRPGL